MSKFHIAAALVAAPLLFSSVAMAQSAMPDAPMNRAEAHQLHCTDHYAREAAHLAYLEAKLNLTDKQRPLWEKLRQVRLDAAAKSRDTCQAQEMKPGVIPTVVEREARMQQMLTLKVQAIQASQPALQALYDSLTPAQRSVLDQPPHFRGGHGGHGWSHHGPGGRE